MIFRRRARTDPAAAIQAFWTWWATARPRAEKVIGGAPDDGLVDEVSRHVEAIHPDLQWEFTAGRDSTHMLVVTSAGDSGLRSLAERWRRAGPGPDATFGYAAARLGSPTALEAELEMNGHRLDLSEVRFGATTDAPDGERPISLDVEVWHPSFATMPDDARTQIAFLVLDWLLGEDVVEIWIGDIRAVTSIAMPIGASRLAAMVEDLAPPPGESIWYTMAGERRGRPIVAVVRAPLKAARWPAYDLHIRIDVPYRDRDENGFPSEQAFAALYALEDRIDARVDGAVVVAHEASDGLRTTHLYAERETAAAVLEPLLASWPDGRIRMKVLPDPRWDGVAHLA